MDATQWAGVIAFGGAALMCFWVRLWPWIIIGTINLAMAIECGLGMRHRAHNLAIELMGPLYANRVGVQIGLIIGAVFVVLVTASLLLHRKHWRVPAVVTTATALAIALFSVETISLHAVDALLYQPVAGLLVIGWVWAALSSVTAVAAYRVMSREGNLNT